MAVIHVGCAVLGGLQADDEDLKRVDWSECVIGLLDKARERGCWLRHDGHDLRRLRMTDNMCSNQVFPSTWPR